MPQKSNTSDKTLNEDILKELKNINSQLLNLNNKIEESNLLARESKSNEDATRYTNQISEETKSFEPKKKATGRPRKTTVRDDRAMKDYVYKDHFETAAGISKKI
ncbi:Hypothetical predicted protein [Octopus vulgaris]|uniref:Uncharacterized protein n=1 Tax=Octopus vulgaris TaxID=6645 RepID=A0AA36BBY1_OCTVU|nr:Hypothetical predicted protein [Octopus vulgaris]